MTAMEPLLVSLFSTDESKPTAAKMLGVKETKIKELVHSGEIPSFKLGGLRMVAVADVRAYVDRLRAQHVSHV